jgi:hypothetical protein
MKVLIVLAHHEPKSFSAPIAQAACDALSKRNERERMRELFADLRRRQPYWSPRTLLNKLWDKRPVGVSAMELLKIAQGVRAR